ncbi:MAG: hypothetical protein HY813_00510 [Candidatus Portnoybacteria bacterium]|nr:hypothetical protein [Candidatus Portnoybacteria bacterium]
MFSKKINLVVAASILFAGVVIGGVLILQTQKSSAGVSQQLINFFTGDNPDQNQNAKNKDSDRDGLTDWQETEIYRTDPFNPDTDGDGYLDGEEVVSGYDTLKAAPDDKLTDNALNPRPNPGSLKINLTEELAKAMTANIKNMDLGKIADSSFDFQDDESETNNSADPQIDNILDSAFAEALVKSPQLRLIPVIQDSDIIISDDTSPEAIKNFSTKVSAVFDKFSLSPKDVSGPDIQIAFEAIQSGDFSLLNKYIDSYRQDYQEIKQIPAPSTWKEIHKQNLTLILGSANIFEALKSANEDPLKGYIVLQQYNQIIAGAQKMTGDAMKLIGQ